MVLSINKVSAIGQYYLLEVTFPEVDQGAPIVEIILAGPVQTLRQPRGKAADRENETGCSRCSRRGY